MLDRNKKILLIPGWMNGKGMYGDKYEVLEIWKERLEPVEEIEARYLIGHSLGCHWALLNWKKFPNTKLILVNPPLPKRNIFRWFRNWLEFQRKEDTPTNKEIVKGIRNKVFGWKKCYAFFTTDFSKIIKEIPREMITIVRGTKDDFFCDKLAKDFLEANNIPLIEIEAGHDWNENIDREIEKLLR